VAIWRVYLTLTLTAMFWGGTFSAGRLLAPRLEPAAIAAFRFLLATALLAGWLAISRGGLPRPRPRQWLGIAILAASGVFAYNLFFFSGLQSVEAGRAALIIALNPGAIALASHWFSGEALGPWRVAGITLSLCGALVVVSRGDLAGLVATGVGGGEALLLGCVASWTLYTLAGKRLLTGMAPLPVVAYASGVGAALLLGLAALRGALDVSALADPVTAGGILYFALFGTVLAFVWYYDGVRAIGAARAAQFINLVPVFGVTFGALLLGEAVTGALLAGGVLVVAGLWLTHRAQLRP
jgi:drug/metabolite transporter (DMT)-like permease